MFKDKLIAFRYKNPHSISEANINASDEETFSCIDLNHQDIYMHTHIHIILRRLECKHMKICWELSTRTELNPKD